MIRSKVLILTTILFLNPVFAFSQQNKSDDKSSDAALKEKAYALLESLSTQISTLQSAENRARIGSNIAGSLWPHDEKRARALFVAVGQDIRLGFPPREISNSEDETSFFVFLQLRTDTIDRIARYDPEFAFDFLKTTEPPYEEMEYGREKERKLAVGLAKRVIATNPDLALKFGRVALAQGFSEEVLTLLRSLLRKHRPQGVTLQKEIVSKLRNEKFGDNYELVSSVRDLLLITPPLADEAVFGELTNILNTALRANNCGQERSGDFRLAYFCYQIAPMMERRAKSEPLVADSWGEVSGETEELVAAGDFDGLMQLAEQNPAHKTTILWRAFNLANSTGNLERGEKIAAAFDGHPDEKQMMVGQVERAKDAATLNEAEIDEIERKLASLTEVRLRANYLAETAARVGANNRALGLKLLNQLTELVETNVQGSLRTEWLISLAVLYCMEKSDRGFTMMESQMPKLNEIIDAAVKLDGFDTHYLRDGEWNMSGNGSVGKLLTWLSSTAPYFAWCDFDRAVSLAAQFERAEIRMMAQLKLAQGIIAGPPIRIRRHWGRFRA